MRKLRPLYILAVFACAPLVVCAQTIKVLNSTQQPWSGGIAGHSGDNHTFSIRFSDCGKEPIPDTIWLGQYPVELIVYDHDRQSNTNITHTGKTYKFDITAGTFYDEYADRYPSPDGKPNTAPPHSPVPYKGVAMLSYTYNGRHHYYVIPKIKTVYPTANYP